MLYPIGFCFGHFHTKLLLLQSFERLAYIYIYFFMIVTLLGFKFQPIVDIPIPPVSIFVVAKSFSLMHIYVIYFSDAVT